MDNADSAASLAIFAAKRRGDTEVGPDHLLLGCLRVISRFGIVTLASWTLDLESLDVDWLWQPEGPRPKVAYSQEAVELFDRAAQIAKSVGESRISVNHLLAAFANEEIGLMGELKRVHGITSASWRAAVGGLDSERTNGFKPEGLANEETKLREYLTPEEAAQALNIHVQTMRTYIRSGRLPAFRVAGERAIRILRADLGKVLEPLEVGKKEES